MESESESASANEGNSSVVLKYLAEAPLQKFYYLNIFSFKRDQENPTNLNPSLIWLPPNFFEYVKEGGQRNIIFRCLLCKDTYCANGKKKKDTVSVALLSRYNARRHLEVFFYIVLSSMCINFFL